MKIHTHQQKNLGIETKQNFDCQKHSKYRQSKLRGNTLVPVIIALAISALATIAFLNQGAQLSDDNKVVIAQNQIASALAAWLIAKDVGTDPILVTPNNFGLTLSYTGTAAAVAASGSNPATPAQVSHLDFLTPSASICKSLKARITNKMDGVKNNPLCTADADANAEPTGTSSGTGVNLRIELN